VASSQLAVKKKETSVNLKKKPQQRSSVQQDCRRYLAKLTALKSAL